MTDRDNSMTAARKPWASAAPPAVPSPPPPALRHARAEKVKERARELRRNPTPAQAAWTEMSGSKLGALSFCGNRWWAARLSISPASRWIVVQISPEGANADLDAVQDKKLADIGIRVLRFAEAGAGRHRHGAEGDQRTR
jgi:very-short-patch-repair endonuclease